MTAHPATEALGDAPDEARESARQPLARSLDLLADVGQVFADEAVEKGFFGAMAFVPRWRADASGGVI